MKENNSKKNEETNNILCPLCSSKLLFKYINTTNKMFLCSNNRCLFPMENSDMDKYIFNTKEHNLNEFMININKLVFEQSLSNDTHFEEIFKNVNKNEIKLDSKNLEDSDFLSLNNHFYDSFSENDNIKIK